MKIISYLNDKKVMQAAADTISYTKDFVSVNTAHQMEEIKDMGHKFTQAVKAKYFTKKVLPKQGGEVEMTYNSETGKLEHWTRKMPDDSIINGRIIYKSPYIKKTIISNENSIKQKIISKHGNVTEILTKAFDLTRYPEVTINETEKIFRKGVKNSYDSSCISIQKQMESCMEKQDYIDMMSI